MFWLLASLVFAGPGVDVGSGGDLVRCYPHPSNDLAGLYSLDYLVMRGEEAYHPSPVTSYNDSLFRIRRILVEKLPELLPHFDDFANNLFNTDQGRPFVWEDTEYEVTEIHDEDLNLAVKPPLNCRQNDTYRLVQAVIRMNREYTGGEPVVFKYMSRVFDNLTAERPLQLSFLLVHEWLWSLSDKVDRNRRINWFLHSEEFGKLSRVEVISRLKAMGLDVSAIPRIVDARGNGHFRTLQEALANHRDRETLLLRPGVYSTGGLPLHRPVKLVGEGPREDVVIQGTMSQPALSILHDEVEVSGVSFENPFLDRDAPSLVRMASGGKLRDCRFVEHRPGYQMGVEVREGADDTAALIENCLFVNFRIGVRVISGKATVRASVFENNGLGVWAREVAIEQSKFHHNRVGVESAGVLTVKGSHFFKNTWAITGKAHWTLLDGVRVQITNGDGIELEVGGPFVLRNSLLDEAGRCGVDLQLTRGAKKADFIVEGNEFISSQLYGFCLGDSPEVYRRPMYEAILGGGNRFSDNGSGSVTRHKNSWPPAPPN